MSQPELLHIPPLRVIRKSPDTRPHGALVHDTRKMLTSVMRPREHPGKILLGEARELAGKIALCSNVEEVKRLLTASPFRCASSSELRNKTPGGQRVYAALRTWIRTYSIKQELPYKNVMRTIFDAPSDQLILAIQACTTPEEIRRVLTTNFYFGNTTAKALREKKPGGGAVHVAIVDWVKRAAVGNEVRRRELMCIIFPEHRLKPAYAVAAKEWRTCNTVEMWRIVLNKNPEWARKNYYRMIRVPGATSFLRALSRWLDQASEGIPKKRARLMIEIFGSYAGQREIKDEGGVSTRTRSQPATINLTDFPSSEQLEKTLADACTDKHSAAYNPDSYTDLAAWQAEQQDVFPEFSLAEMLESTMPEAHQFAASMLLFLHAQTRKQ